MEFLKILKGDSRSVTLLSGFQERAHDYQGKAKLYYDFRVKVDGDEMVWSTSSQNKAEELNRIPLNSEVRIELKPLDNGRQTWVFHTNDAPRQPNTPKNDSLAAVIARLDKIGGMVKDMQDDVKYIKGGIDALAR